MASGSDTATKIVVLLPALNILAHLAALTILFFALLTAAGFTGTSRANPDEGAAISCNDTSYKPKHGGDDLSGIANWDNPNNQKYKSGKKDDFVPIYQAAAKRYKLGEKGPNILASIHEVETGFGSNRNTSSAGAQGHTQFMPATWRAYGVDANGDGTRNPGDPEDAIFASARYLKASGAPGDWRRAIFAYNHADWYVNKVVGGSEKMNIEPCA